MLAKLQGWPHIACAILFPAGVALMVLKGIPFIAAPIIVSLILVAAIGLVEIVILRTSRA